MKNLDENCVDILKISERPSKELFIYECGYEKCKPHKPYEFEHIDYYLIHYVLDGEGIFVFNNKSYTLKKGDGFLIPPNKDNTYYPSSKNPWTYRWIGFNGTESKSLLKLSGLNSNNPIFNYSKDNFVDTCFENLFHSCRKGNLFSSIGYLYLLLGKLIDNNNIKYNAPLNPSENYLSKVIDFIHNSYNHCISIKEMASLVNLSRSQLFKIFKNNLNLSPQQYLINYRLNKACEFLRKSSYSISEICYLVGFNSPSYFSKIFTKYKNKSPLEYRNLFIKKFDSDINL